MGLKVHRDFRNWETEDRIGETEWETKGEYPAIPIVPLTSTIKKSG